jgi:hypothetical protein
LAMRAAISLSTGTPATSAMALISFAVGLAIIPSLFAFSHCFAGARLRPEPAIAM